MEFGLVGLGAGLAIGLTALGAGVAERGIGAAALGAIAERKDMFSKGLIFTVIPETIIIFGLVVAILMISATGDLLAIGAGLAIGLTGLGAGIAERAIGSAAVSAIAEKSEMFSKGLILTVIPETIVIFGLVIAILTMSAPDTFATLGAGLAMGLAGLGAGYAEKEIGAAAVSAMTEKSEMFSKGLIFTVIPETLVIFGLVIALMLLGAGGGAAV
jgi:V/A-type H+-transporting ATPase subunit K